MLRAKPLRCELNLYAANQTSTLLTKESILNLYAQAIPANAGMPSMCHASTLANTSAMSSLPDKRYAFYLLYWYWYKGTKTDAAGAELSSLTNTSAMSLLQNTSVTSVACVSLAHAPAPAGSQVLSLLALAA